MMRRLVLSLLAVGIGLLIVVLSAVSIGQKKVRQAGAQIPDEEMSLEREASDSGEVVEEVLEESLEQVDYYLPYPGILPDHPLYFLKMIRDQVKLLLTSGEAKTQSLVLYGDKRVGAAKALVEGNKIGLGASTALKAEQYLDRAVIMVEEGGNEEFKGKIYTSAMKHKEVIEQMQKHLGDEANEVIEEAYELNKVVLDKLGETLEKGR